MKEKGFLLIETLLAALVFSIAFVAFVAVMVQVLKTSSAVRRFSEDVRKYEEFIFELENGERMDLVTEGGRGPLGKGYRYDINILAAEGNYFFLKSKLSRQEGNESMELDLILPSAPVQ